MRGYQNEFDQYIPWHADSCIYKDDKDNVDSIEVYSGIKASISLESPGVVAFARRSFYGKNYQRRKENQKLAGVRGALPLFPGDLMIMCGTFQEYMVQKTLPLSRVTLSTIVDFPAVNRRLKKSLEDLIAVKPDFCKRKRVENTFQRNVIRRANVIAPSHK